MVAEFWDCLRLDPAPVTDLRRHYEDHVRQGGQPELIVDMNGVEFAGSSALGGFLGIQRHTRQHNGRIIFCNVDPQVREVFRISKLEPLFLFASDVSDALKLVGEGTLESPRPSQAKTEGTLGSESITPLATSPTNPEPRRTGPPPLRGRRKSS